MGKMKTLSDFCNMQVLRTDGYAEIIFHIEDGHLVRLIGFKTSGDKTDYQVAEEGYGYYKRLLEEVNKIK